MIWPWFLLWSRCDRLIPPILVPFLAAGNTLDMLVDRACPQGGWNAGNSVVFGVELDPHPDFTAMALLALANSAHSNDGVVHGSLRYLHDRLNRSSSPYSLGWAVLALSTYGHAGAEDLRSQLERETAARIPALPSRVLALTALALEQPPFRFEGMVR